MIAFDVLKAPQPKRATEARERKPLAQLDLSLATERDIADKQVVQILKPICIGKIERALKPITERAGARLPPTDELGDLI